MNTKKTAAAYEKAMKNAINQLKPVIKLTRQHHVDEHLECPHCRAMAAMMTLMEALEYPEDPPTINWDTGEIETYYIHTDEEWWETRDSGVSFPCQHCGKEARVQLREAKEFKTS